MKNSLIFIALIFLGLTAKSARILLIEKNEVGQYHNYARVFNQIMKGSNLFWSQTVEEPIWNGPMNSIEGMKSKFLNNYKIDYVLEVRMSRLSTEQIYAIELILNKVDLSSPELLEKVQPDYFKYFTSTLSEVSSFEKWMNQILDEFRFFHRNQMRFKTKAVYFSEISCSDRLYRSFGNDMAVFRQEIGKTVAEATELAKDTFFEYISEQGNLSAVDYELRINNSIDIACQSTECLVVNGSFHININSLKCHPLNVTEFNTDDVKLYLIKLDSIYKNHK